MGEYLEMLQFLGQTDSSGVSDFLSQISGLIALTCGAGLLWVILMILVMQRAAERRRRQRLGLEALPGIHTIVYQRLKAWFSPETGTKPAPTSRPAERRPPAVSPTPAPSMPAPDLGMLTGDIARVDAAPAPQPPEPTPPPEVPLAGDLSSAAPEEPEPVYEERSGLDEEPPDSVEVMRVWRDLSTGSLVVEIGGRRFDSVAELRSTDLERRFVNVVRELDTMVRPPGAEPGPATPAQQDRAPAADDEAPPVSMSPGAMLRQMTRVAMGQTPTPTEELPPLSIADEIEDLLQQRLVELPSFSQRTIHVRPSFEGGVRIEVDGQFYDGVGDVEDDAVRELLISVVHEWESQQ